MNARTRRLIRIALGAGLLLLIPLLAMQVTDQVSWTEGDFVVMGVLLLGAGLTYELIVKREWSIKYRVTVGILIGVLSLLIWAELAVGIFGTPFAGS